ncbi:DUF6241 domain-containing protein [Paenibacillus sp. CC-CFT747]|nr:DUF6241 domain-containing protein [Paenibacillus sp. CC-CFT747]
MKNILLPAALGIILGLGGVAYAKEAILGKPTIVSASAQTETQETSNKSVHPYDREGLSAVDPTGGPNQDLLVLEPDLIKQIKKMNDSGEWMNRVALIANLHAMTHQKIKADDIRHSIKMTQEMIDLMVVNIKNTKDLDDPVRSDVLSIAENWKAGDFTQADKDHNYFWTLQGGTIGKATGIASPEEEKAFIAENFADGRETSK